MRKHDTVHTKSGNGRWSTNTELSCCLAAEESDILNWDDWDVTLTGFPDNWHFGICLSFFFFLVHISNGRSHERERERERVRERECERERDRDCC